MTILRVRHRTHYRYSTPVSFGPRRNLIRVAVTRDPSQAIPLSGSFTGATNAFLGMDVQVEVTADAGGNG